MYVITPEITYMVSVRLPGIPTPFANAWTDRIRPQPSLPVHLNRQKRIQKLKLYIKATLN